LRRRYRFHPLTLRLLLAPLALRLLLALRALTSSRSRSLRARCVCTQPPLSHTQLSLTHTAASLTHTAASLSHTQSPPAGAVEAEAEVEAEDESDIEGEAREHYVVDRYGRLCKKEMRKKETKYILQLNFHVVEKVSVVTFEGDTPITTLVVFWRDPTWPRDRAGDVFYWALNEPEPDWSNVSGMKIEIAVREAAWSNPHMMYVAFQQRSHLLERLDSSFGVSQFKSYLQRFPALKSHAGVQMWGYQPNGMRVFANCVVTRDGDCISLADAGVFVHAYHFTNPTGFNDNPIPVAHFPRLRVCRAPWIVLYIFRKFFFELIPSQCGNNAFLAQVAVIDEIVKIATQQRSARGDGTLYTGATSVTVIVAREHSNRKTNVLRYLLALCGLRGKTHMAGNSSPTAFRSQLDKYCGLLVTIDDWDSNTNAKQWGDQIKLCWDSTVTRGVQKDSKTWATRRRGL
jgi:hypothetical protein